MTAESLRGRGMRDLLPEDMQHFRRIERAFREEMLAWGYEEVRTPTIEPLHLFTSAGTLSPQLLDRVYSFLDWDGWSGERVVLRPDSTIPAARVYAERAAADAGRPAKVLYVQNIFRFADAGDEPRESWQCGVEVYGDTWPAGDVELLAAGRRVLARLGFEHVRVRLSHTGVLRAVLSAAGYNEEERADRYLRLFGGDSRVRGEIAERLPALRAPLDLLLDVTGREAGYLDNIRAAFGGTIPAMIPALEELALMAGALSAVGCPFEISMALARDFEYYTGPVFRFAVDDGQAVGLGGRYDDLVRDASGAHVPACGFAFLVERLAARLTHEEPVRAVVVHVAPTAADAAAMGLALSVAEELQANGFRAELVGSRRAPWCRWALTVDRSGGSARYRLEDLQARETIAAGSMERVLAALGRGRC